VAAEALEAEAPILVAASDPKIAAAPARTLRLVKRRSRILEPNAAIVV
jgi:hypothetical protein